MEKFFNIAFRCGLLLFVSLYAGWLLRGAVTEIATSESRRIAEQDAMDRQKANTIKVPITENGHTF